MAAALSDLVLDLLSRAGLFFLEAVWFGYVCLGESAFASIMTNGTAGEAVITFKVALLSCLVLRFLPIDALSGLT